MLESLAFTFGTREILKKFIAEHPDRKLVLLANSAGDDEGLQLLDVSGQPSLFKAGLNYQTQLHQGASDWQGFYHFSYFKFDHDTADVFDAKINRLAASVPPHGMRAMYVLTKEKDAGSYLLLTIWNDSQDYLLWRDTPAFEPLKIYATSANHFHSASYHRVSASETK
ncbi:MAG TPA: antibiotic biosynthesis monooxygenase [Candidatus Levilactobacillus faecigallinarum]|uniref:Antibiotic biosynthesis monooxygenase n=1 Tax=Candidatus Levilactobacillus faecigallinarum TaxID=2838638 RepID=A0A9D1QU20_9LACO|nr:antibiotic biosynthesis monooxygenase [Candidatus Levilactobacillus faecigallinarum]